MTLKEIKATGDFLDRWSEYREKATRAQVWTENGHRIDGANRGDHHDNGITVYRPDAIPRKHRGRILRDLLIQVSTADEQTITAIVATYGHYPETVEKLFLDFA